MEALSDWFYVYSSYAYWYQRLNGVVYGVTYVGGLFSPEYDHVSQYGGWRSPLTHGMDADFN
jgi:hypothetical protein